MDRFALALYPMLDAGVGAEVGLSPAQWRELGAAVEQIHAVPLTPALIRLLAYYRAAWAVQDIASYGQEALLMPALGEETRRAAVAGFMGLFEPGNIIDVARASGRSGSAGGSCGLGCWW
jgi:hypothetical protein